VPLPVWTHEKKYRAGVVAQVVEHLPSKHEAQSSNSNTDLLFDYYEIVCLGQKRKVNIARRQWLTPVIPDFRRQRSGGSSFKASPGSFRDPMSKKPFTKKGPMEWLKV
jgi:hypothetical protein